MNSKKEVTEEEKKLTAEILAKYKAFMKDGKIDAAKDYLLKKRHELRNSN